MGAVGLLFMKRNLRWIRGRCWMQQLGLCLRRLYPIIAVLGSESQPCSWFHILADTGSWAAVTAQTLWFLPPVWDPIGIPTLGFSPAQFWQSQESGELNQWIGDLCLSLGLSAFVYIKKTNYNGINNLWMLSCNFLLVYSSLTVSKL